MEMFKTIKEYPLYSVSTMGRIRKNSDNKILSPSKKSNGYMQINLFTNDGRRKKGVCTSFGGDNLYSQRKLITRSKPY